jgi:hypothetical protein
MMRYVFLVLSLLFIPSALFANPKSEARPVVGWVEKVSLQDVGIVVKARMDTGAGLSSLDAEIVKIIEPEAEGGKQKVIFHVMQEDGEAKTVERDIVSWVNIKKKGDMGSIRRPVVRMDFCFGGKQIDARVNLADRKGFLYPMLIGRNILETGNFLIDPTKSFLSHPGCGVKKEG